MTRQPPYFHNPESHGIETMCVKDVAKFLKISQSWVYKHYDSVLCKTLSKLDLEVLNFP